MDDKRYTDFNSFLRNRFGCRVQKITVDAGMTCPNRDGSKGIGGCIYCNSLGSGTGVYPGMSITEQLENAKKKLSERYKAKKFIAYFQAFSNTFAPVDELRCKYEEALAVEDIVGLSIGTRPDCLGEGIPELLEDINQRTYLTIEYGLQSAHDRTLALINRGHAFKDFTEAVSETRKRNIDVCAHVILGLPGESKNDMLETARILSTIDIQSIKIHLLYVISGTELHEMYKHKLFRCLTMDEYVEILCEFISILPAQIVIQRLTGDPHPKDLVAPEWAMDKVKTLKAIDQNFKNKEIWQGKNFKI